MIEYLHIMKHIRAVKMSILDRITPSRKAVNETKEGAYNAMHNSMVSAKIREEEIGKVKNTFTPGNGIIGRTGRILIYSGVIAAAGLISTSMTGSPVPGLLFSGAFIGGLGVFYNAFSKEAIPNVLISGALGTAATGFVMAGAASTLPGVMFAGGLLMFGTSYFFHQKTRS